MNLSLSDRIKLQGILPRKGDFKQLIILEDINKKVKITQEEIVKYGISNENNMITWKENGDIFDIYFTELETTEIKNAIKELDKAKNLTADLISLCKLFEYNG